MFFFLFFAFFTALTCSGFGSEAKISFDARIKPFFQEHCLKCHGKNDKIKGKLDLREYNNHTDFLNDAEKIEDIISVILDEEMPPEEEPKIDAQKRILILDELKNNFLSLISV